MDDEIASRFAYPWEGSMNSSNEGFFLSFFQFPLPSDPRSMMLTTKLLGSSLLTLAWLGTSGLSAQAPQVSANLENMRIRSSSVSGSGNTWNIDLTMGDDNGNTSLPTSYRRWWHVQVGNLNPLAATNLRVRILRAGYTDIILPCWSQSLDGGKSFGSWTRMPLSAVPRRSGSTHSFSLTVPKGVTTIRIAKYFPYTVSDKDRWLSGLLPHKHIRSLRVLGRTRLGRPLQMLEITNKAISDKGKKRVWIHAGIHPAENTSYWVVEGLVAWLLSGKPEAERALGSLIFDIVPMANPDGVYLGNYRTNSRSVNLENQWRAPYNSTQNEIVALRTQIEAFMGTSSRPGANPIEALFNLHSTHGNSYPLHFQHVANASFNLRTNSKGVIPAVHNKEGKWIAAFKARSPLVAKGRTLNSTAGWPTRPFVESMMHDRWSIDGRWTGSPNFLPTVMAITFEGTYGFGPDGRTWNTPSDYRRVGAEMGLALMDYFGIKQRTLLSKYGGACGGTITGFLSGSPQRLWVNVTGPRSAPFLFSIGGKRLQLRLPFGGCTLLAEPLILAPMGTLNVLGSWTGSFALPAATKLRVDMQALLLPLGKIQSTEGLEILR